MTLNLNDGSFKPYHKPDDSIHYINKESNHPLNLIKHLPASVEKRLLNHSSDKKIFKKSAIYHEDTSNETRYINKLVYHALNARNQGNKNKNCERSVIWFNPPNCLNVTTRIGQSFLPLMDTNFPEKKTPLARYSTETKLK